MKCKSIWKKILSCAIISTILLSILVGCGAQNDPTLSDCTVTVKTQGGMALEDIGIYIYEDATKAELVSFAKTDASGVAAFAEEIPASSVAVLENVPAGYAVAESYCIEASKTDITLSSALLQEMTDVTPGSIMFDFTVKDTDGTEHTLSQLLQDKKAVVLNLWYISCGPCKAEFPYLQEAYSKYSDSIALLALNPVAEDDEAGITAYKTENSLSFPMIKCDSKWEKVFGNIAYPTTVIIDRFGMVSLIHTGSIDSAKTFEDAFAFFAGDQYVQTVVDSISSLVTGDETTNQGNQESTTPETTAPTVPPETTEPPATTAPTKPPATTAPTKPPATTAPTKPPATTAPTKPPETSAPTEPPATTAPSKPDDSDSNTPLNTNGTLVNPDDATIQFMETFETESIGGGELRLYAIMGIGEAKISIKDKTAYIIYNNKTYVPEDGVVTISIKRDDANVPTLLKIGNGGTTAKTYSVTFKHTAGTQANPIKYKLDEAISTTAKKGNAQGVYYTFTASKAGVLTITIDSCTSTFGCGVTITTKTVPTIQEAVSSLEGSSVSIELDANQKVEIVISALPDARGNYPKATIKTSGKFE